MPLDLAFSHTIKGFMADEEALRLYEVAGRAAGLGCPCLEIGSYCGRSAFIIGSACREQGMTLFSLDHHRGSEEQQPGEAYHDPDLFDPDTGGVNTLPAFRHTLALSGLEETVVAVVASSETAGRHWQTPLSMVFIDGGHSLSAAMTDYRIWEGHLVPDGMLVIHDIFMNPQEGGQAPRQVYATALASGRYRALAKTGTLGVLQRRGLSWNRYSGMSGTLQIRT